MVTETLTRLNCEIPDSINKKLNEIIPTGSKSDVVRKLLDLYIEANSKYGRVFVIKLLDNEAELVVIKPSIGT